MSLSDYSDEKNLRCQFCGYSSHPEILHVIIGKNKILHMCPTCTVLHFDEIESLEEDERFIDDITGYPGAILLTDPQSEESYCLNKDAALRMINRSLTQKEWKILNEKYKSRGFNFEIHDDFYDDNGGAIQPNTLIEE